jgi:hypothetical protein
MGFGGGGPALVPLEEEGKSTHNNSNDASQRLRAGKSGSREETEKATGRTVAIRIRRLQANATVSTIYVCLGGKDEVNSGLWVLRCEGVWLVS